MTLPLASDVLIRFGQTLRRAGFLATSDQGMSFLAGTRAVGPKNLGDIRLVARAIYGPPLERQAEFEALFDTHFLGRQQVSILQEEGEENPSSGGAQELIEDGSAADMPGQTASVTRVSNTRKFAPTDPESSLRRLARLAPGRLPERRVRRMQPARKGRAVDRLRTFRQAMRYDGEVLGVFRKAPGTRLRPILILIDISGSMKAHTEDGFRVAHHLMRLPTRVEVFSMGTDLTRLIRALRSRSETDALAQVSDSVRDFDGGTRLGETLGTLLRTPQWMSFVRGAIVITFSDGLEVGGPDGLVQACERLSRLAFAHLWLTPLANTRDFVPQTEALRMIAPHVDEFGSANSIPAICAHLLGEDYFSELQT